MIRIAITFIIFLTSLCAFSQEKTIEAEFNGRLCNVGRGLCDVKPPPTKDLKKGNMKNYTTYKKSENTMVIELDLNKVDVEDQKKFFGKEYSLIKSDEELNFVQEADFVFSKETLDYLGFDQSYKHLKSGTYPLEVKDKKITITLTLSKD